MFLENFGILQTKSLKYHPRGNSGIYRTLRFLHHFEVLTTSIQSFDIFFKGIMEIPKHFLEAITFRNMFIMVKSTVVRAHLLFLLATVLVWRQAVNRQPGFRSDNS